MNPTNESIGRAFREHAESANDGSPWLFAHRSIMLRARELDRQAPGECPKCPECSASVLYECVACSSSNYPAPQPPAQDVPGADDAMHWIDRYAAGIDEEPQMDRIAEALGKQPPAQEQGEGLEFFTAPEGLHPETLNLIARFAGALAEKLAEAERKYGWGTHWQSPAWMDQCREQLVDHVAKGDPRDVAAYCAFLWHHGEPTAITRAAGAEDARDAVWPVTWKQQGSYREVIQETLKWNGVPCFVTGRVWTHNNNWPLIDAAIASQAQEGEGNG